MKLKRLKEDAVLNALVAGPSLPGDGRSSDCPLAARGTASPPPQTGRAHQGEGGEGGGGAEGGEGGGGGSVVAL